MANLHSTATQYLHHFIFRVAANAWNECGMTDCNRTVKHTTKEPLPTTKRQVHDFVGQCFEGVSPGYPFGELGFVDFSVPEFFKLLLVISQFIIKRI